ncbi:MAG: pantoate--beta-alanine ligase [Candidatus Margulisbacteria bacterium]|nr:pantoate--beta-alanine ligase [Candidatus Margulisiibacteriota bacterium]
MLIIKNTLDYLNIYQAQLENKKIGFVPTMGFLHEGHLSLVKESVKNNQITIVSIFINPTQFVKGEDFATYPKNTEHDLKLLEANNVDIVFIPEAEDLYPPDHKSLIKIEINQNFTNKLCGKHRRGHFGGVALIVMKLFSIIQADNAYFGLKDYQQYVLIKNLSLDFFPRTKIHALPTIRESSGLAMSSRNTYLNDKEKKLASLIYATLLKFTEIIKISKTINQEELIKAFEALLLKESTAFELQYLEIYDDTLNKIKKYKKNQTFIGTAVYLNNVRLIDNLIF